MESIADQKPSWTNPSFEDVASEALRHSTAVLEYFLPGGIARRREYVVCNPTRNDATPGSFSVNLETGDWADFATDDAGGDLISLVAYVHGCQQHEAKRLLTDFLESSGVSDQESSVRTRPLTPDNLTEYGALA